jgi:membrane protease YdiL (CAAX protease family)
MTTPLDLVYVGLFAVGLPLLDYLIFWPAFRRRVQADPARARKRLYVGSIVGQWVVVAIGAAIWLSNDRSWTAFGFSLPDGWQLWVPVVLVVLLAAYTVYAVEALTRDPRTRASAAQQCEKIADVLPHTRTELYLFGGVSLTAGFCEEFMFRGYFTWVLAPWLGWWGAAALSVAFFAGWHAYQGWNGVLRTAVAGSFFTIAVAVSGSLWPAIALHALVDLNGGVISWLALREAQPRTTS